MIVPNDVKASDIEIHRNVINVHPIEQQLSCGTVQQLNLIRCSPCPPPYSSRSNALRRKERNELHETDKHIATSRHLGKSILGAAQIISTEQVRKVRPLATPHRISHTGNHCRSNRNHCGHSKMTRLPRSVTAERCSHRAFRRKNAQSGDTKNDGRKSELESVRARRTKMRVGTGGDEMGRGGIKKTAAQLVPFEALQRPAIQRRAWPSHSKCMPAESL